MKFFDVCIIGGGASGCMAAVLLAQKNVNVCVVDRFDKPAKKLLVTGNGKCNITNLNMTSNFYNQNIDSFLKLFNLKSTINFFKNMGLDIYADEEGRCYPISNSAKSVQHCFINQFEKLNINFFNNSTVNDVDIEGDNYIVYFDEQKVFCKQVIFACGLNEFSLKILNKFNIKYNDVVPSLVALKTKQNTKKLDGIRISNVKVSAFCNDQTMIESGEILFKDNGISGICIFNLSSLFAKNKCFLGEISINLLKKYSNSQIFKMINEKLHIFTTMQSLLESMFYKEVAKEILLRANVNLETLCKDIEDYQIKNIINIITNFNFDIIGHYQNNQVQGGGVNLQYLDDNLQNINSKGMFFCGEICDIDGVCGGYNLQWAWTSAFLVANSIKKDKKFKLIDTN